MVMRRRRSCSSSVSARNRGWGALLVKGIDQESLAHFGSSARETLATMSGWHSPGKILWRYPGNFDGEAAVSFRPFLEDRPALFLLLLVAVPRPPDPVAASFSQ